MNFKVSKRLLIYMIGIQSLFSTYIVTYIRPAYYLNLGIKLLFMAWLILTQFEKIKNNQSKIERNFILVIGFNVVLLVSTVLNHGNLQRYIGYLAVAVVFLVLPKITLDKEEKDYKYIDALAYVFRFNIYINFIGMIIFPSGLAGGATRINYLGYDNIAVPVILTGFVVLMYRRDLLNTSKFWGIIDLCVCTATIVLLWSGTGIVGYVVLLIMSIVIKTKSKTRWLKYAIISTAVVFAVVVVFNSVDSLASLVDFLGKDLTFTGRTYIWKASIETISRHPFLGQGIHANQALVYNSFTRDFRQAHNEYLQIVLNCGYLGLVFFMWQFIHAGSVAEKAIVTYNKKENAYLIAGLVSFLVISLTETYGQYFMTSIILGLCYYNNNSKKWVE